MPDGMCVYTEREREGNEEQVATTTSEKTIMQLDTHTRKKRQDHTTVDHSQQMAERKKFKQTCKEK